MKNKLKFAILTLVAVLIQNACTNNFDEINTDPVKLPASLFDANYLLSQGQYEYSNTGYSQLLFQSMWPQVLASTYEYYKNGDKYLASSNIITYQNNIFNDDYHAGVLIQEMQNLSKDKPELSNLVHIGTIMKVLIINQITDCYGDVPYTEAWRATEGLTRPVYDTQQDIYMKMLADLETAIAALDASKPWPTADLFYKGDPGQWKKFGYSLMLRIAMRLVKVDPATAQRYAEKAAAGGTFSALGDNALVRTDIANNLGNNTSSALRIADDYREVRWSEVFIGYLKARNDPRLGVIAEVPQDGLANNSNQDLPGDSNPAIQIGLPNGYDLAGDKAIQKYAQYPGPTGASDDLAILGKYSRPTTALYLDRSGPNFILTYAQTELLLAEAKVRGWNVGSETAAKHFRNGVVAAMMSLAQFNTTGTITEDAADTFVNANPLDVSSPENAIKMINEEYWVATGTHFNFIETWSNWRRSGYPVLTPVVYPNQFSTGGIPRRIPYHSSEPANNPLNYAHAVSRLSGGDTFTARIWWDKN